LLDFETIYKKHSEYVFKYIFTLSGDYHLSQDITQETFLIAYKSIEKFEGKCELSTWLCAIAKKIYYSSLKKNKNTILLDENYPSQIDLSECIIDKEKEYHLKRAIDSLDGIYKIVFDLHIKQKLTHKEIGLIMNKSEVWARTTFYRANEQIRNKLRREGMI